MGCRWVKLCLHAQVLGLQTHSFFLAKVPFLVVVVFLIQKRVWQYRYAYYVPLVTLILNIYVFVGLAPFFFLAKIPFLASFFNTERGAAI